MSSVAEVSVDTDEVLVGAEARRHVISLALRSDAWGVLRNLVPGESVEVRGEVDEASLPSELARCRSVVATSLTSLGLYVAKDVQGTTFTTEALLAREGSELLCAFYAFQAAVEEREQLLAGRVPALRAIADALEVTLLLWLDGVETPQGGDYKVGWVQEAAQKAHAVRYFRQMGISSASTDALRRAVRGQADSVAVEGFEEALADLVDETGRVPLRYLREAEGMQLSMIALAFLGDLRSLAEGLQEWSPSIYDACERVLDSLRTPRVDGGADELEAALFELSRAREYLTSRGLLEVVDEDGTTYRVEDLDPHQSRFFGALRLWREALANQARDDAQAKHFNRALSLIEQVFEAEQIASIDENLTTDGKTCHEEELATGEGTGAIDEATPAVETEVPVREDFAAASPLELEEALIPEVPQAAVDRLEELVRGAREETPADPEAFVRSVNRILDAHHLRFRVGDGVARLCVRRNAVQYAVAGRGQQSLSVADPEVQRVSERYGFRGRKPTSPLPGVP